MGCASSTEATAVESTTKRATLSTKATMAHSTSKNNTVKHEAPCKTEKNEPTVVSGSVKIGSITLHYGCCSQRGRDPEDKKKPNQDCFGVIHYPNSSFFGVFDGHGPHGQSASQFVKATLPTLIQSNLSAQDDPHHTDQLQLALSHAHTECNDQLHAQSDINDAFSGTTSISVYFHHRPSSSSSLSSSLLDKDNNNNNDDDDCTTTTTRMTIANVGDSRAILGTQRGSRLTAVPLLHDHTPHRSDEAARCQEAGARILSFGQLYSNPKNPNNDDELEDPPRVWSQNGSYPGTAFTRSMGDRVAESLGVYAQPELVTLKLSQNETVLCLASDGIFDVLDNQQVLDHIVHTTKNTTTGQQEEEEETAMAAAQAIVAASHQEWLLNEDCCCANDQEDDGASYDDMTVIVIFLMHNEAVPLATLSAQPLQKSHHAKRVRQKTLRNLEEMDGS